MFNQTVSSKGDQVMVCRNCGAMLERRSTGAVIRGLGYEVETIDNTGNKRCHDGGPYHNATWAGRREPADA